MPEGCEPFDFDFVAADDAAHELEVTVQVLSEAAAWMEAEIPNVVEDWRGGFRRVFDVESATFDAALRSLAEDMLLVAAGIRAKAIEAAADWSL